MIQIIIVIAILTVTVVLTVRWVVRTLRGHGGCPGGCSHCPKQGRSGCHCQDGTPHLPDIKL